MNLGGTVHITKTGCCVLIGLTIILVVYFLPEATPILPKEKLVNLNGVLAVAIQAAESGGREVVALLDTIKISSKGKTKEGANDSVTTADFNSHCVMTNHFKNAFPTLYVVSEEDIACATTPTQVFNATPSDVYINENRINVWIDPLDATQEYTEKLTQYVTTMVCVAIDGKPTIGVIHQPFTKRTYWAWVDHGHSDNLKTQTPTSGKLNFVVSRSHTGEVHAAINSLFKDNVGEIVTAGGAGYKVLEVVLNNAVYVHTTAIKKWDICAGNAVLNALGGAMTTLKGKQIDYGPGRPVNEEGVIASLLPLLNKL